MWYSSTGKGQEEPLAKEGVKADSSYLQVGQDSSDWDGQLMLWCKLRGLELRRLGLFIPHQGRPETALEGIPFLFGGS